MCDELGGGEILLLGIMFLIFSNAVECIGSFFFFLSGIKLYEYTRFYLFFRFWIFGLFLGFFFLAQGPTFAFGFGKYEYSCDEPFYSNLCVDICFYFSWVNI